MPADRTQDEEITRLTGLGARIISDRRPEFSWVLLADPEGNEFDVEISRTELAVARAADAAIERLQRPAGPSPITSSLIAGGLMGLITRGFRRHGTVTVRGYISVPTDQAWFFSPPWQGGEREADEQIADGEDDLYRSDEDFLASFNAS